MTRWEPIPADELAALKTDDSLERFYADQSGRSEIELRVAYYGSQRGGERQPHSPKVCLPGGGWMPIESRTVRVAGGEINVYVVYQAVASEWITKALTVVNGVVHRRTDVALVRLVIPGNAGQGPLIDAALRFAPLVISEMQVRLR